MAQTAAAAGRLSNTPPRKRCLGTVSYNGRRAVIRHSDGRTLQRPKTHRLYEDALDFVLSHETRSSAQRNRGAQLQRDRATAARAAWALQLARAARHQPALADATTRRDAAAGAGGRHAGGDASPRAPDGRPVV